MNRSSRSQMFEVDVDVLKNFEMFTGKHLCWSLFLIERPATLLNRCFPVNIAKFFKKQLFY